MKNVVTMHLPEEVIKELEDIAKVEHLDSMSLIRKMLFEDVEEYPIVILTKSKDEKNAF